MMRKVSTTRVVGFAAWLAVLGAPLLQGQRPIFTGRTDLVRLDVIVLDKQRRPVTGLTAADFSIVEEGRARSVDAFAAITLPDRPDPRGAAWTRRIASDVVGNQRPEDGRLVVIMMDHSIPVGGMTTVARRIAHAAVDSLSPDDLAAVVVSSPFTGDGVSQDFTADRDRLSQAIDSPFMGVTKKPPEGPSGGVDSTPSLADSIACHCGVCQWEAIIRLADAMGQETRRQKVLLFIARELKVQVASSSDVCAFDVRYARDRGLRALDRANVTVHSIDPSGLETLAASASGRPRTLAAANLARQGDLAVLPDYTGGRAVIGTNDPAHAVPGIFDETSSYYLLGFSRGTDRPNEDRRKIRVMVRNRDDVTVRTRTGYYGLPDEPPSTPAGDALAHQIEPLLPVVDLPLRLAATPMLLPDGRTGINLLLGLDATDAGTSRPLDVLVAVFDRQARPMGSTRQTVTAARSTTGPGFEWPSHFPEKPGDYEIRIGVTDRTSGRSGSVYAYVNVPDPGKEAVVLAGPQLAVASPGGRLTLTLRRAFTRGESVAARLDLHRRPKATGDIIVRATVIDEADRTMSRTDQIVAATRVNDAGIAEVTAEIPVAQLAPGRYLLRLELVDAKPPQRQELPFTIVE
jgi:VWFA-related protein